MSGFLDINIAFLNALAELRTPVLDWFMALITHIGEETVFMIIAIVFFWCIDKKKGYLILLVGFLGTVVNQFMKITFRIPRPWVLDSELQIVESARAEATGYSFPSGHTQNAVGTLGTIACVEKNKWVKLVCIVLALLVAFSRVYLGVHTPFDVVVSIFVAIILILTLLPAYRAMDRKPLSMLLAIFGVLLLAILYKCYAVEIFNRAEGMGIDLDNARSAVKNGYTISGACLGCLLVYYVDSKWMHFEVRAAWWAQIIKAVVGFALVLCVKTFAKAPLYTLMGPSGDWVRYFLMVVVAGILWPFSFPLFKKTAKHNGNAASDTTAEG